MNSKCRRKDLVTLVKKKIFVIRTYFFKSEIELKAGLLESIQDFYIKNANGVLHVGAHFGQEADRYHKLETSVIWIEAIPSIHNELQKKIKSHKHQISICAFLGDRESKGVKFYIASNNSASSSMYRFGKELGFRNLRMNETIRLDMKRLDRVITTEQAASHNHWVLDVQGAELLVLIGAGSLISFCESMIIEVSTRQVYENAATWEDIRDLLEKEGLHPLWYPSPKSHENIIFIRRQVQKDSSKKEFG